jgi:hypothetical protein
MYSSREEFSKWQDQLGEVFTALEGIVNLTSFKGKAAESIKAYI